VKFISEDPPTFPQADHPFHWRHGIWDIGSKGCKLSSVVWDLKEDISTKKVEGMLIRMLSAKGLEASLPATIAAEVARKVHRNTLIIIDPSDVQKPYAKKMAHLTKSRMEARAT
jgi:hypothetical protein